MKLSGCACTDSSCAICQMHENKNEVCYECNSKSCTSCTQRCYCITCPFENPSQCSTQIIANCISAPIFQILAKQKATDLKTIAGLNENVTTLQERVSNFSNRQGGFLQVKNIANRSTNAKVASSMYKYKSFCNQYCSSFPNGCINCTCQNTGYCKSCVQYEGETVCS